MCFGETANVREASDVPPDADPMPVLLEHFGARIERARALGATKVVVDPGMGFHYGNLVDPLTRSRHQTRVLSQTFRLRPLGVPVCNVLPHTYDIFGDEFRKAEGFYAVFAALGGTHLLRVHEVPHLRVVLERAARARGALRALSRAAVPRSARSCRPPRRRPPRRTEPCRRSRGSSRRSGPARR